MNYTDISAEKDLVVYLNKLKGISNCILIVAVKDNAGYWLNERVQSGLNALGLKENLIKAMMTGYIGIINDGTVVFEKKTPHQSVKYESVVDGHTVNVASAPFNNGDLSSIIIDGKEYSCNSRGLNIVIFDKAKNKAVDSVAFDTHVAEFTCSRNMNKYDVGIFGWWYNQNYGATLTYYALNRAITDMGHSVIMLYNSSSKNRNMDYLSIRFANKHYNVGPITSKNDLRNYNNLCNAFVLGSDQVWNPDLDKYTGEQFYLSFADENKPRIAYAQSFGNYDKLPAWYKEKYTGLIRRFSGVSAREDYAQKLLRNELDMDAPQVCDPVFLVEREAYDDLAKNADLSLPEKYLLCFLLDPDESKLRFCEKIKEKYGFENIIYLTDLENSDKKASIINSPNVYPQTSLENFINAYRNASYVVTDSFHGTCMAVIYRKNFISLANVKRGAGRFESLMRWMDLKSRLFYDYDKALSSDLGDIDYDRVYADMHEMIEYSYNWLKKLLPLREGSKIVTDNLDMSLCVGCGSCVSACPNGALSLKTDTYGYYISSVDYSRCINCGICTNACPVLKAPENPNKEIPDVYEFISDDDDLLDKSTSGGFFTQAARIILEKKGIVVGAAWREDFTVEHIIVDKEGDLYKLRKSKYLQSYTSNIDKRVKEYLDQGRYVLFTGTPCQVAGLRKFLKKDYDNLLVIDILCGNSPSAMFFKKYLDEKFGDRIKEYQFRDKSKGYNAYGVKVWYKDGGEEVFFGPKQDNYQRVYHSHVMTPKHCEKCRFQALKRYGDLSIGDFWWLDRFDKETDQSKGINLLIVNNDKGKAFLESIPEKEIRVLKKVPETWTGGNGQTRAGVYILPHAKRDEFYKAILKMPFSKAVDYALKPNHGIYPLADRKVLVNCTGGGIEFDFDDSVWEKHVIKGKSVFLTRQINPSTGKYAKIPLMDHLVRGKKYTLSIRFMIRTNSKDYSFYVKASGSSWFQNILNIKTPDINCGKWIEKKIDFIAESDVYDEFMIGAAQLTGQDAYIAFDKIIITEKT